MSKKISYLVLSGMLLVSMTTKAENFQGCEYCWKVFLDYFEISEMDVSNSTNPRKVSGRLLERYHGISKEGLLEKFSGKDTIINKHIVNQSNKLTVSLYFPQDNYFLAHQVWFSFDEEGILSNIVFGSTFDYSYDVMKLFD